MERCEGETRIKELLQKLDDERAKHRAALGKAHQRLFEARKDEVKAREERDELEGKNILNKNALRLAQDDARCAMRLAGQVTLDTQSAEEAMVAVLKLLEEARRLAYDLATYGSPLCPASSAHDREWIAKEWKKRYDAAILFGAPAPKAGGE